MRKTILLSALLTVLVVGCNDKKQSNDESVVPEVKNEQPVADSARECFEWVKGNDTVAMHYTRKVNNVSGALRYAWFEKDKNLGTFVGVFKGDTLRADFKFQSEGLESVREVVFVRQGDQMVQGNGDMEEKNGKMVFTGKLDFNNSISMTKMNCE